MNGQDAIKILNGGKRTPTQALKEWHEKFGVPIKSEPGYPGPERAKLRIELIREEFREFVEASDAENPAGVADAVGDLLYVVIGAGLEWGIPVDEIFEEVHRSNMTKVWPDGTVHYREDGKVLKPPTYSKADIRGVLEKCGLREREPNRIICRWCGADPSKDSKVALARVNETGVIGIWECTPYCIPDRRNAEVAS